MIFEFFKQLFCSFSRKEYVIFGIALAVLLSSSVLLAADFISKKTTAVAVSGGSYIEGVIGQPSFINPVLALTDADKDVVELVFDNLDNLSESNKMDDSGKVWHYRLKENAVWHDGQKVTSDDIIFTIETIQNTDVRSPLFSNWQGVSVSRVSEREVEFRLPIVYVFFESTLKNLKPIPKHVFGSIPAANIRLSNYNLEPVGSGPFKYKSLAKRGDGYVNVYNLERNENYSGKLPYLNKIAVNFYNNELEVITAFNTAAIDGFGTANPENLQKIAFSYDLSPVKMLKYYALFFNSHSHQALKDKNVKLALQTATNKKGIIEQVFNNYAIELDGPLIEGMEGFDASVYSKYVFSVEKANQILESTGWKKNSEGIREKQIDKDIVKLEFNLVVPDISFLAKTADLLKAEWENIGVRLNVSVISLADINDNIIKARDYQMIIFGNILGENPDIFSFWHSSEKFYPGLNLALYENKLADGFIESIRKNLNKEKRNSDLASLQSLISADLPAIFLYSPEYLYISKKNLGGFDEKVISFASERFRMVEEWYVKTAVAIK